MESADSWWLALVLGIVPVLTLVIWSWNYFWFISGLKGASTKLPPGNLGLPIIGELFTFLWYFKIVRRPDDFINAKRRRYGDGVGLYRTYLFGSPSIIACSPESIKFVLQSDMFSSHSLAAELIGENSFAMMNGETHKTRRTCITTSINSREGIKDIITSVQPLLISSLHFWAQKGRFKALDEARKVSFENIIYSFISFKQSPMLYTMNQWFVGLHGGFRAQPWKVPGTAYYHAVQCKKKLTAIFRKELEKRKLSDGTSAGKNDLMENLMRIRDEDGTPLGDSEVVDMIIGLVLAGYESTASSMTWALYYLAKNNNVLQKLREENLCMHKNGDCITIQDVAELKYTNKVVEEILRMANIAPFLLREAKRDVTYQGCRIPKGWRIFVWLRYLHTNPENFTDPLSFNPERWNSPPQPGTFQAFGGGVRLCAGNKLARTQLAIFLHHLVISYKWELINPDAALVYLPVQMPNDGLEVAFSRFHHD
ncbi:ent-kaurenoic acid monooxygenase [Ranunculus cassubicifolius]